MKSASFLHHNAAPTILFFKLFRLPRTPCRVVAERFLTFRRAHKNPRRPLPAMALPDRCAETDQPTTPVLVVEKPSCSYFFLCVFSFFCEGVLHLFSARKTEFPSRSPLRSFLGSSPVLRARGDLSRSPMENRCNRPFPSPLRIVLSGPTRTSVLSMSKADCFFFPFLSVFSCGIAQKKIFFLYLIFPQISLWHHPPVLFCCSFIFSFPSERTNIQGRGGPGIASQERTFSC